MTSVRAPRPRTSWLRSAASFPGLAINTATDITCVDINDAVKADNTCRWGVDYVRVRVTSSFVPITPIVSMFGSHVFESYSRVRYYP